MEVLLSTILTLFSISNYLISQAVAIWIQAVINWPLNLHSVIVKKQKRARKRREQFYICQWNTSYPSYVSAVDSWRQHRRSLFNKTWMNKWSNRFALVFADRLSGDCSQLRLNMEPLRSYFIPKMELMEEN